MIENPIAEWSLFNEEGQSFISKSSQQPEMSVKQYYANKGQQGGFIYQLPLLYVGLSLLVLLLAIISQFHNFKAQTFPLFPELPFQGNYAFTIGVALISFIGILIDYFIYILNQRRSIQQGCYVQKVSYHSFPLRILAGGILSHFFFFAFALLPTDQKQRSTTLYAEDRIFLTLSFILNFIFKGYYVFFSQKFITAYQSIALSYQVKTALFTVICFIFSAFACVNVISLCLGMSLFQEGEPEIFDKTSAAEDFISYMVGDIYSTLAYCLYIVNSLFVGMYYYDLKLVSILMTIQETKNRQLLPLF